jgi:hypothetical protein
VSKGERDEDVRIDIDVCCASYTLAGVKLEKPGQPYNKHR